MKRVALVLALVFATGPGSGVAHGGAWSSYMHAYRYAALAAAHDTVWCATREAGLFRFDAARQRFDTFTREPSGLAGNQLTALALDRSGWLWVGTQGGGVSRLSPNRSSWELLSVFDGLPSDSITVIEAHGDTVLIGTSAGIALWDGNAIAGAIPDGVNPSPFASNAITGLAQLRDSIWVSTRNGIYVSRLSAVPLTWSNVTLNLPSPVVNGLANDGTYVFAFASNAAYIYRGGGATPWEFVGDPVITGPVSRLDHANGVVTASAQTGIYRWNADLVGPNPNIPWGNLELIQADPPYGSIPGTDAVYVVVDDPVQGATYAANPDGVHVLTPGCIQCPVQLPPGPPGNNITNLALEQMALGSQLYIVTNTEGVGRFDGTRWRNWFAIPCTQCDTTFMNPIYPFAAQVDRLGKKWVACWGGPLEQFDDSVSPPAFTHHDVANYPDPAQAPERHTFGWATAIGTDSTIWFGLETNGAGNPPPPAIGLDYYSADGTYKGNFRPGNPVLAKPMRGGQIRGLTVDHNGRFWVGYTGDGLQYFDWPPQVPNTPEFETVVGAGSFYVQNLRAFGDSLWVLTDKDLRRYSARTAKPAANSIFSPPGETPQNAVRPLDVGPDGSVYLGTAVGLRIYHPGGAIQDFNTTNSPLVSDQVRAVFVDQKTGVVWIGTAAGLNRYDPYYVPPAPPARSSLNVKLFPNPMALTAIGTALRLSGDGDVYQGTVCDLSGRVVNRFSDVRDGEVFWSGYDTHGSVVKPGVYFVRVASRGRSATSRVVLVR
jgi:streptogramin lyase